jgi:hypothetical protein
MGGKSSTSTQTVSIPPEVMARYNAVNARAEEVAKTPFQAYQGQFVAPINPTQQAGIQATGAAASAAQPYYGAATGLTLAGAQDVGALTQNQIGYYQNPYTEAVAAPTYQALRQQQGQERAQQQAQAIKSGAFGGDRAGLERANLARQQELATAQTLAPIYQQGYQQAVQTAQGQQGVVASDLARRMQAGQQIAGLGTGAQAAALQGAQAQIGAGTLEQQTQQADLTARYQQFLQERGYDFQTAQFLANIAMGTGALSGSTTTTTQPQGLFSDRRLKENVKKVGETNDGLPIYTYNYKGDNKTQMGLMAQDVEKKKPEAVGLAAGFKTVDYDKATEGSGRRHRDLGGDVVEDFDPNSMGGAVDLGMAGEAFARGGYAVGGGGGLLDATDLSAILAAQKQSFGPFSQAGLYGGQGGQDNPMGGKSYVPKASLPTPKLITPAGAPKAPQSALSEAMQGMKNVQGLGETAAGIGSGIKKAAVGAPAVMKDGKVVEKATTGLIGKGGETGGGVFNPKPAETAAGVAPAAKIADAAKAEGPGFLDRAKEFAGSFFAEGGSVDPHHRLGYAGLGKVVNPMDLKDPSEGVGAYIDDASESQGENKLNAPNGGGGGGGKSGGVGNDLMQAGQLAMMASKAAPMVAEGFSALMAALPFSDERLKSNVEHVGKTFDGQNIYTYNLGDGPTQMGLIAQEAVKKHPDAVGHRKGYMTLDYAKATEDAADRGHFYNGGLVPGRHGYATDGTVEDTPEAIGAWLIGKESGGDPRARAKTSSAAGLGQFTDSTAREVLRRNPDLAAGVEYDPNQKGFAASLPEGVQRNMVNAHVAQQMQVLRDQGLEPTRQNIRMNWFLGEGGGPAFIRGLRDNPDLPAIQLAQPDQVKANQSIFFNRDGAPRSASEVYDLLNKGGGGGGQSTGVVPPKAERAAYLDYLPTKRDTATGEERVNWKQLLIPALTGIGAAATTPTRNLGTALAAGLGAGAQSYANLEKQQADVESTKAGTFRTMQEAANLAFTPDGKFVRLENGDLMPVWEWFSMKDRPTTMGGPGASSAAAAFLEKVGLPKDAVSGAGAAKPAPAETAKGTSEVSAAPAVGKDGKPSALPTFAPVGASSKELAKSEPSNIMGWNSEGARASSNAYTATTQAVAGAANQNVRNVNELANIVAKQIAEGGIGTSGTGFVARAELVRALNTLGGAFGGNVTFNDTDSRADLLRKLGNLQGSEMAKGADQRSLGALNAMIEALPQGKMTREAQAQLTSQIIIANQAAKDREIHRIDYGKLNPGINAYSNAGQAFENDNQARYTTEQELVKRALMTKPKAVAMLTTGNATPQQIEEFFQTLAKDNKMQYSPGMYRYFPRQ